MNYESGPKFGTVFGGYCSLGATLVIWLLTIMEIYTCFTSPVVYLALSYSQLEANNNVSYSIPLEAGFPAFYIETQQTTEDATYNDESLFDFYYLIESSGSKISQTNVTASLCSKVIP